MCNFLGVCSAVTKNIEVVESRIPIVTIPGLAMRTIKRSSILSISAKASISSCANDTSLGTSIIYSWSLLENGELTSLVSTSKDSSTFLLPAYSLTSGAIYTLIVSAAERSGGVSSMASTQISVISGDIVVVLKGGTARRIVRIGDLLQLDGSTSYDENLSPDLYGVSAGLSFSWSCMQIQPVLDSSCATLFESNDFAVSQRSPVLSVRSLSNISPGSIAQMTLTVASPIYQRLASVSIDVEIVASQSPTLTLTSNIKRSSNRMNPTQNLQLSGTVNVPSPSWGNISWSMDKSSSDVDLGDIALSPLIVSFRASAAKTIPTFLSIKPNSLSSGVTYSFILSCFTDAAITTSIQITINSPPQPGIFFVSPNNGYELQDSFSFVATSFQDSDLPLMYSFSYLSIAGKAISIRSISEAALGNSLLPAGSATSNFRLVCICDVYDSMIANTTVKTTVTVMPRDETSDSSQSGSLLASTLSNLDAESSTVDEIKQASAIGLYLLNKVNCTLAPDCAALNRNPCSKQSHTCGSCISYTDYVGVEGDSNEPCVFIQDISSPTNEEGSPKVCINDCSGHGQCKAYSSVTHEDMETSHCFEGSQTCFTSCVCDEEYSNSISCSLTNTELQQKIEYRDAMISYLSALHYKEDFSDQSVESQLSSFSEVTGRADELSEGGSNAVLSTVSDLLKQVLSGSVISSTSLSLVTTIADNVGTAILTQATLSRRKRRRSLSEKAHQHVEVLKEMLRNYSSIVTSSMVPGQIPSKVVTNSFKLTSYVLDTSTESFSGDGCDSFEPVTLANKAVETILNRPSQSISIPVCSENINSDETTGRSVSLVSMSSSLYEQSNYISDPLSLEISSNPCSTSTNDPNSCTIELIIPRTDSATLESNQELVSREVICEDDDFDQHLVDCPDTPGLHVKCNGTYAIVTAICPPIMFEPSCSVLSHGSGPLDRYCSMIRATDTAVHCRCSLLGPLDSTQTLRALSSQSSNSSMSSLVSPDGTVSVSYVSMLTGVTGSFVTTVNTATDLNASMVRKGWQAVVTLSILAAFFLSAIFLANYIDEQEKSKEKKQIDMKKHVDQIAQRGNRGFMQRFSSSLNILHRESSTVAPLPSHEHSFQPRKNRHLENRFMEMAEEALPNVLISSRSLTRRIMEEMKRHHRWLGVIYYFSKKFPRVLRLVSLATNIIVMLFIQSLTYDLTKGDDGSCESFKTEESCLAPKSQYSTSMSRCYWTDSSDSATSGMGYCRFIQPDSSFEVVIFVAIFSALLSSPIAVLADYLIEHVLSLPTRTNTDINKKHNHHISAVVPQGSDVHGSKVRRLATIFPSADRDTKSKNLSLIGYEMLAKRDLSKLHEELKAYRLNRVLDEQRAEFDCKL